MTATSAGAVGPGTVLAGRYRLEDLLTENSGAWFWRATDTVLSRNVAIHAVGTDDDRAAPMLEAARVSATVNDPHLLRVLDCAEEGPVCWVVHEWGEGLSLDLMLERGPLAPDRAAWLAKEVADAVAAGHAQGVAHGRLNPEAVLVTHSGGVKLIGYVVDASLHRPAPVTSAYGELDPREADVIDTAGILYAALTCRWPGVSDSRVPAAPLEGTRPLRPRQVRAGVPRALDAICERVLHREGSRHELPIEDARELAAALADVTGTGGPGGVGLTVEVAREGSADSDEGPGDEQTSVIPQVAVAAGPTAPSVDTDELEATRASAAPVPAAAPPPAPPPQSWQEQAWQPVPEEPHHDPYVESPDRPLFATTERRVPAGSGVSSSASEDDWTSGGRSSPFRAGAGSDTGTLAPPLSPGPESWHADRVGEPSAPTEDHHEGRGWLRTAVVVGLVLLTVVAMIAAFALGQRGSLPIIGGDDEGSQDEAGSGQPIAVEGVADFDPPPGDGTESPEDTGAATDGDTATTWSTVTYYNRPDLGGLKPGVGLMLDLGSDQQVGELDVLFAQAGTDLEVYAAPAGVTEAPSSLDAMEQVGAAEQAEERARVPLDPAPTTRFVLLWLTQLPEAPGGFQGEVAEVVPRT